MGDKKRSWGVWGRLLRIAFLPVQVLIFSSMAVPVLLGLGQPFTLVVFAAAALGVAAHIFWFAYGTILNDYHDQDIDGQHPFGRTVFTEGHFTEADKKVTIRFFAFLAFACELPQFAYIYHAHSEKLLDVAAFGAFIAIGYTLATAYSVPPLWAKRRLLGPLYTLMLVYVFGFLRFCLLFGGLDYLLLNGVFVLGTCWFLYVDHGITSASLKDIPDAPADEKGGSRSIPLVYGPRTALRVSVFFLGLTAVSGVLLVVFGWLHWWFLLTYTGILSYIYLYREVGGWMDEMAKDPSHWTRVPLRKKFLLYGYILNWGIWIPCFMLAFDPALLG